MNYLKNEKPQKAKKNFTPKISHYEMNPFLNFAGVFHTMDFYSSFKKENLGGHFRLIL